VQLAKAKCITIKRHHMMEPLMLGGFILIVLKCTGTTTWAEWAMISQMIICATDTEVIGHTPFAA